MNRAFLHFCLGAALVLPFPAFAEDISLEQVVLRGLDKVTGRLNTMTVNVGEKTTFGALDIYARVCYAHPPEETPENAAFLEIVEKKPEGQLKLFSGWMFSSSPALSAMEHAVYDVWVIRCQGEQVKPPKPEPLVLENPIESKPVQPKLKLIWNEEMQSVSSVPENEEAEPVSGEVFSPQEGAAVQEENKPYMILQMEPVAAQPEVLADPAAADSAAALPDAEPAMVPDGAAAVPAVSGETGTPAHEAAEPGAESVDELPVVPAFRLTPIQEAVPEASDMPQEENLSPADEDMPPVMEEEILED